MQYVGNQKYIHETHLFNEVRHIFDNTITSIIKKQWCKDKLQYSMAVWTQHSTDVKE